jgi:hypothetical protein
LVAAGEVGVETTAPGPAQAARRKKSVIGKISWKRDIVSSFYLDISKDGTKKEAV